MNVSFRHHGRIIRGDLAFPKRGRSPFPAVLIVHGRGSDRGTFPGGEQLRKRLLGSGYVVMRIDLSGHGQSDGRFEELTLTNVSQDVAAAVGYLQRQPRVDEFSVAAIGHSLGGSAILGAQTFGARVKTYVLLGPVADPKFHCRWEYSPAFLRAWRQEQFLVWTNRRNQTLALKYNFYRDLRRWDFRSVAHEFHQPVLLIHGRQDTSVPLVESQRFIDHVEAPKKLVVLPLANHNFTRKADERAMIEATVTWMERYLKRRVNRSVVVFALHQGMILALKRSDKVWYYPRTWALIGGHLPDNTSPIRHAIVEVTEELGVRAADITVRRVGREILIHDPAQHRSWKSFPILVELKHRRIKLDWEHTDYRWVEPKKFPFSKSYQGIKKQFAAVGLL